MVKYMEGTSSEDAREYHCNEMVKRNGYSQYYKEYSKTKNNKKLLNEIFKRDEPNTLNDVSEILKEIYSKWFFNHMDFNNPLTKFTCRKIDEILPKDDGGGPVQFKLY